MLSRGFAALIRRRCELSVRVRVAVLLSEHHFPYSQTVRVFSTPGRTVRVSLTSGPTARLPSTDGPRTDVVAAQKTWVFREGCAPSTARKTDRVNVSSAADLSARVSHDGPEVRAQSSAGQKAKVTVSSPAGQIGQASSREGQTSRDSPDDKKCNVVRVPSTAGQTGRLSSTDREGQKARVALTAGETGRASAVTVGGQIDKFPEGMSGVQIGMSRAAAAGQAAGILSVEGPSVRVSPPEGHLYGNVATGFSALEAPEALQSTRKFRASQKKKQSALDAAEMALKVQLLDNSGVTPSDLKILLKKRAFVSAPFEKVEALFMVLKEFFRAGDVTCKVLTQNPGTLVQPIEQLKQKLMCLEDFQVGEKACMRIGTSKHCLLTMTPDSLRNKLSYLQSVGLTVVHLNLLLCKFPQVLRLSIEISMHPTVVYLEAKGMAKLNIAKLISEHPTILGMSVDKNLVKKFELLEQLGLSSEDCLKSIGFLTLPSCETVLLQVEALKRLGFSGEDVLEMLRKKPDLLVRSHNNLNEKLNLLVKVENRDVKEIVRYPACLCYNLEKRIIPRIKAMKENGQLSSFSLASILSMTEATFRRRFNLPFCPSPSEGLSLGDGKVP